MHVAEPLDATWSARSEVDILAASIKPVMARGGLRPHDLATDCRSKTCRISASFDRSADARKWATMLVTQLGGTLSQVKMTVLPEPDGGSEVRIYGVRRVARG